MPESRIARDNLLVEALDRFDQLSSHSDDVPAPDATGDFEHRLRARALLHPACGRMLDTLSAMRRRGLFVWAGFAVVMALLGVGSTSAALSIELGDAVNVFLVLTLLLGLNLLGLLLWLLIVITRGSGRHSFAGMAIEGISALMKRWSREALSAGATQALSARIAHPRIHGWVLGAFAHVGWLCFSAGALLTCLVLFSVRQYDFVWSTTLLSTDAFVTLTRWLGSAPAFMGFQVPDAGVVVASEYAAERTPDGSYRGAWSQLLLGALLAYGVMPRLLLAIWSFLMISSRNASLPLQVEPARLAFLRQSIMPVTRVGRIVDPDLSTPDPPKTAPRAQNDVSSGAVDDLACVGVDLPATRDDWPPAGIDHLGDVVDRNSRREVMLRLAENRPSLLLIGCSATMTPDRGAQRVIGELRSKSEGRCLLALLDGEELRARDSEAGVNRRLTDWQLLAERCGIAASEVIEIGAMSGDLPAAIRRHLSVKSEL